MGNYKKIPLLLFFIVLAAILLSLPGLAELLQTFAGAGNSRLPEQQKEIPQLITVQDDSFMGVSSVGVLSEQSQSIVIVTGYSSDSDQTDDSPYITASGSYVRDGIIAANFLSFGTKVKFPTLYKDRIFIVEDRMKNNHQADIWFPTREQALEFGVKKLPMLVLENE